MNRADVWISIVIAALALAVASYLLKPTVSLAGHIRHMPISEERPGQVTLAFGQTTALSFFSKPEKVVPGSPQKLQIDFLGKDLTISPLARDPGNLLVYTKSGRYVILLKMGTAANYDDVVEIEPLAQTRRQRVSGAILRLAQDSMEVQSIKVEFTPKPGQGAGAFRRGIAASVSADGRRFESEDLLDLLQEPKTLRCESCRVFPESRLVRIVCTRPLERLACHVPRGHLVLKREKP